MIGKRVKRNQQDIKTGNQEIVINRVNIISKVYKTGKTYIRNISDIRDKIYKIDNKRIVYKTDIKDNRIDITGNNT